MVLVSSRFQSPNVPEHGFGTPHTHLRGGCISKRPHRRGTGGSTPEFTLLGNSALRDILSHFLTIFSKWCYQHCNKEIMEDKKGDKARLGILLVIPSKELSSQTRTFTMKLRNNNPSAYKREVYTALWQYIYHTPRAKREVRTQRKEAIWHLFQTESSPSTPVWSPRPPDHTDGLPRNYVMSLFKGNTEQLGRKPSSSGQLLKWAWVFPSWVPEDVKPQDPAFTS